MLGEMNIKHKFVRSIISCQVVKYCLHSFMCFLPQSSIHTVLCTFFFCMSQWDGNSNLLKIYHRFENRCKLSSQSQTSGHIQRSPLQLPLHCLKIKIPLVWMEPSNGSWGKDGFLFHFFLGINICSCSWIQSTSSLFLFPFEIYCAHSLRHILILCKSK